MKRVSQIELDRSMIRQELEVVVLVATPSNPAFPPTSLNEFAGWLEAVTEKIPLEHRGAATIQFRSVDGGYGCIWAEVEVSYSRPETDEEWDARKADVMNRLRAQGLGQPRAYEALTAKFEQPE